MFWLTAVRQPGFALPKDELARPDLAARLSPPLKDESEEFKAAPSRIQSQDSALCLVLDRLSRQARRVGDDPAANSRLGSASQ
jgi:hypothetical protein